MNKYQITIFFKDGTCEKLGVNTCLKDVMLRTSKNFIESLNNGNKQYVTILTDHDLYVYQIDRIRDFTIKRIK